jgi:dCMP deaminase
VIDHIETQAETDRKWLRYAYDVAGDLSTDPSTQNAAVLVDMEHLPGGFVLLAAANCFPRGVQETPERWERPLKYSYVEHAERNAIYAAAYQGVETRGLTMYVPWFACSECARAIIQAGISEVVGHKAIFDRTMARWKDTITVAHGMLTEAGVKFRMVDGEIGGFPVRFDGQLWQP